MSVGRPAMMKSPAMNAAFRFLIVLANRAKAHFEQIIRKHQKEHEIWQITKKVREEEYKRELKEAIKNHTDQTKILFHEEDPPLNIGFIQNFWTGWRVQKMSYEPFEPW